MIVRSRLLLTLRSPPVNIVSAAPSDLFGPAEVAAMLHVDPKTVSRWAVSGKIRSIRTPGGHRQFLRSEIAGMIEGNGGGGLAAQTPVTVRAVVSPPQEPTKPGAWSVDRAAAEVISEAVSIAARVTADRASSDATETAAAVAAAARRTAAAARRAREARMQAAEDAAEAVAAQAARAAADLKIRADRSARKLVEAASAAAALVASVDQSGFEQGDEVTASHLAAIVYEAAVVAAEERADAAVRVASAVTAAAAAVAIMVSGTDISIEGEVAKVAAKLQYAATAQAREVAAETDARATAVAVVAREAAGALRHRDLNLDAGPKPEPVRNREMAGSTPVLVRS